MPDWIFLIIAFVEKYVIAAILGFLMFFSSYALLGEISFFKRSEVFWAFLSFCILCGIAVTVYTRKLFKYLTEKKEAIEIAEQAAIERQKAIEAVVLEGIWQLPIKTQQALKNGTERNFHILGQETLVKNLKALGIIRIISLTPFGLYSVRLTEYGSKVIENIKDDIYLTEDVFSEK